MFNLFKGHKRSAWMQGLLDAEDMVQLDGYPATHWYFHIEMFGEFSEEYRGFSDYLDYYENNLRNI